MTNQTIRIPIVGASPKAVTLAAETTGGPASLHKLIDRQLKRSIGYLTIDQESLNACIASVTEIAKTISATTAADGVMHADSIEVRLGVTSTGGVGVLGAKLETDIAAEIAVYFKLHNS